MLHPGLTTVPINVLFRWSHFRILPHRWTWGEFWSAFHQVVHQSFVAWSKKNKKKHKAVPFSWKMLVKRKCHVGPLLGRAHRLEAECPSGATVVHWPSSNIEHELSNESRKCLKTRASRSTGIWCSPPPYCCPPPLHPESPASQARGGSLATQHWTRVLDSQAYNLVHLRWSSSPLAEDLGEGEDNRLHQWRRYNHWRRAV